MHNRSGRSQNVSPPSRVPGASIRPTVGMPRARVHASTTRLSLPVRLARPQRDRPAIGDQQWVEGVHEVRNLVLRLRARGPSGRAPSSPRRTGRAPAGPCRGRTVEEAARGMSKARAERLAGPPDEHFAERRSCSGHRKRVRRPSRRENKRRAYPFGHGRLRRHRSDHACRPASGRRIRPQSTVADAANATVAFEAPTVEEVSGRPYLATLSDIWDDVREIWRQGMDVLRDPRID